MERQHLAFPSRFFATVANALLLKRGSDRNQNGPTCLSVLAAGYNSHALTGDVLIGVKVSANWAGVCTECSAAE
mgnify:CR=1